MEIKTEKVDGTLNAAVIGDVNSGNADQLISALSDLEGVERINVDLSEMVYISSAGLRALLMAEKAMKKVGGKMVISNVQDDVMEIFKITGFSNILTIE